MIIIRLFIIKTLLPHQIIISVPLQLFIITLYHRSATLLSIISNAHYHHPHPHYPHRHRQFWKHTYLIQLLRYIRQSIPIINCTTYSNLYNVRKLLLSPNIKGTHNNDINLYQSAIVMKLTNQLIN